MLRVSLQRRLAFTLALVALTVTACGGGGGSPAMSPISVALASTKVVVSLDGKPTYVQILIMSTSETALVSFTGIPGGVQTKYAASDTNPSGLLTFIATNSSAAGTYMPIITVNSAGQSATLTFTLILSAPMTGG